VDSQHLTRGEDPHDADQAEVSGEVAYVCGHSSRELERLEVQASIYGAFTRRALLDAGLVPGMRILDIGCGAGDVSLLAAELVGPSGAVEGVDRAPEAIATAGRRAARLGLAHVTFTRADLESWTPASPVDGVVGRFVLMHQRDPAALLARARRWLRPGGIVAFVESDIASCLPGYHSRPHSPSYDRIVELWKRIIGAAGAHLDMGSSLSVVFRDAGLPAPAVEVGTWSSGDPRSPIFRFATESLRSMLPMAAAAGIDAPTDEDVDRLGATLRAEVIPVQGVLVTPPAFAAWTRVGDDGRP
jgi:SAM-dependent methyltransferase